MSEVVTQTVIDVEVDEDREVAVAMLRNGDRGMVSAEWAVGLIAAIAIAGVLLAVVTTGQVKSALLAFILTVIRAFANGF